MKRDPRLVGLSQDHHHALVLARTARRASMRDDAVTTWTEVSRRFREELEPHFAIEEELLLPALVESGRGDLSERTLSEHAALRALLTSKESAKEKLGQFGRLLDDHVRFEERELFAVAQAILPDRVLDEIARARR